MSGKPKFPTEAERVHLNTRDRAQRIRDINGKSNAEILSADNPKAPILPLDHFIQKNKDEAPIEQKPDWVFRIALFGMFFLIFLGLLGGVAAHFGWKV
jgi:hypothetical protein